MKKRLIALLSVCSIIFTSVSVSGVSVFADTVFTEEEREIIYWKENVREQGGFYEICGDWLYYVDPEKYSLYAINMLTEKKVKITDYPVANLNVYDNALYYTDLAGSLIDIRLDPTELTDVTLGGRLYKMEEADSPSKDSEPIDIGEEGMVYYDLDFDEDGFFCLEGYDGLMGKDLEYSKINEEGEQIGSLSLALGDEIVKSYEQDGYVYLEVKHIDPETGDNTGYILKFDRDNGTGSREFIFGEDLHAYNGNINYISTEDSYLYQIPDGYAEAKRISVTPVSTYNIDEGTIFAISSVGNVAIVISDEEEIEPFAISTTAPAGGMTNYIEPVTRSDSIYEDIQKNAEEVLKTISDTVDEQISKAEHALETAHVRMLVGDYDGFAKEQENEKVRLEAEEKAKFVGPPEDTGTVINSITTTTIDSAKGATTITDISTMPIDRSESPRENYINYRIMLVESKIAEMKKELENVPDVRAELAWDRLKLAEKMYGVPLPSFLDGWDPYDGTQAYDYQGVKTQEAIELARKQIIEEGYVDLLDPVLYEPVNKKDEVSGTGSIAAETGNSADAKENRSSVDPCLAVEILLKDILSETQNGCADKYYDNEQLSAYYSAYDVIFGVSNYCFDFRTYDTFGMGSMLKGIGLSDSDTDQLWDTINTKMKDCFLNCSFTTSLVEIAPDQSRALVRVNASNYVDIGGESSFAESNEMYDEWAASVGYSGAYINANDKASIMSYIGYVIEHMIFNNPGTKAFDVMLYSDPVLGWVCDTGEEEGKSAFQIVLVSESGTYSGSLTGGESGGAPSGGSAAGGALNGGAPSGSSAAGGALDSAASDFSDPQEEKTQDEASSNIENREHYDLSKQPEAAWDEDNMTEFIRQVELEKANGEKMQGYMTIPFSRPNTVKVTVVDREGTDQKNALDRFLNSLFGFKPDTFRAYSDRSRGSKAIQDPERVVYDNSLPGKRPVEIMVINDIVVDKKPRPISNTLSDIKDSMIDAVKNKYEELYSKVTGTPIQKEKYNPDLHFPPSYEDGVQQPLVELPLEIREKRQAEKMKILEEQARRRENGQ